MSKIKLYQPLIVVVLVVFIASFAIQSGRHAWRIIPFMHDFMGLFLIVFSMFKLFDISGFAQGFSMYDIIAKRTRIYGFIYPFIELFLGFAYLSRLWLPAIYILTFIVMTIGSIGVVRSILKGLDVNCACLGTFLKVPLSTIAVIEDLGMGLMALIMALV